MPQSHVYADDYVDEGAHQNKAGALEQGAASEEIGRKHQPKRMIG